MKKIFITLFYVFSLTTLSFAANGNGVALQNSDGTVVDTSHPLQVKCVSGCGGGGGTGTINSGTANIVPTYTGTGTTVGPSKVTLTAPATGSTITIADGKTFTASNTLTIAGTDSTVMTFPSTSATVARSDAANTFTGIQTFSSNPVGPNGGNINYTTINCGNSAAAGTAISTGATPAFTSPTAGTIVSAAITGTLSAGNCSAVVDIWKTNAAVPTVSNTITASALPTLSTAKYSKDSTLTGWTKTISANDVIVCNVNSSTCDNVNVTLGVAL